MRPTTQSLFTLLVTISLSACQTSSPSRHSATNRNAHIPVNTRPSDQSDRYEVPFTQERHVSTLDREPAVQTLSPQHSLPPQVIEPKLFNPAELEIPPGIALKGQPNTIISPYSPGAGRIDTTGLAPGTKIKDPYSGQIIRVPVTAQEEEVSTPSKQTPKVAPARTTPPKIE